MYESVLKAGKIGSVSLSNRFVMPAMGVNHCGAINETLIAWYEARAKGGFGLIITEFNTFDPLGRAVPGECIIADDTQIPQYSKLTERVHQYDSKIFMQIHHAGRETHSSITGGITVSASAIPCPVNREIPHALSTDEVYKIIEAYGDAALRAKKANFDGVEIHGAHGYLPAQFMSPYVNKRTDEFGGDIEGRAKFGSDIVRNIKKKCGDSFPVCFRISGDERVDGGRQLGDTVILAKILEKAGADAINVSTGVYASMQYTIASYYMPPAYNISAAAAIKNVVKIPVIGVGRINDAFIADSIIEDGLCDYVALGRASIADPEFPNKVKSGNTSEICPCIGCLTRCQGMPAADPNDYTISCAINPFAGHEQTMRIEKTNHPKHIVVVGGGVGGLETSWVAAARGHKVTLLEKMEYLGGQLISACVPPNKSEFARVIHYNIAMCKKHGVDIRCKTEATKDSIKSLAPDVVVIATGAIPNELNVPGEGVPVVQAVDILDGKVMPGNRVLIVGGGLVGLETAEHLISQMRSATVIEMTDTVGAGLNSSIMAFTLKNLQKAGVEIMKNTKLVKNNSDGIECSLPSGINILQGYDMIAVAVGTQAYCPLIEELRNAVPELHVIGDASGKYFNIRAAIDAGAQLAINI